MNEVLKWVLPAVVGILIAGLIVMFIVFKKNRVRRRPYQAQSVLEKKPQDSFQLKGMNGEKTVNVNWNEKTEELSYNDEKTIGESYGNEKTVGESYGEETIGGPYDGGKKIRNSDYSETVVKPFDNGSRVKVRESAGQDGAAAYKTNDEMLVPELEEGDLDITVDAYQHRSAQSYRSAKQREAVQNPQVMSVGLSETEHGVANANLEDTVILAHWRPKTVLEAEIDTGGKKQTQRIYFLDAMTIGRADDCDLCLPFNYVSRRHLQITKKDEQLTIENLTADRTGGYTMLNGEPVVQGAALKDGDVIDIGDTIIRIHIIQRN